MKIQKSFLDWSPDREAVGNEGLSVATNVLHDTEGWKSLHLASAGAFATAIAASVATVIAAVAKPVGAQGDVLVAWVSNKTTPTLHIGINGVTGTSSTTGYPKSFSTAYVSSTATPLAIYSFDVCEYAGNIFFSVSATMGTSTPSTTQALSYSAYQTFGSGGTIY